LPRRDVKDVFLGLDSTGEGTISLSDAQLLKGNFCSSLLGKGVVGTVGKEDVAFLCLEIMMNHELCLWCFVCLEVSWFIAPL